MPVKKHDYLAMDGECARCGAPSHEWVMRTTDNPLEWRLLSGHEIAHAMTQPNHGRRLEKVTLCQHGLFCRSCIGREDRWDGIKNIRHQRDAP